MKIFKLSVLLSIFLLPVPALFNSCAQPPDLEKQKYYETIVGNPITSIVEVKVAPFSTTTAQWSPFSLAHADVSNLIWCFQRLHLRPAGDDKIRHIIPFTRDQVPISPLGTKIEDVAMPTGHFDLVLIELKDNCLPNYKSVQLTNSYGNFATTNQIYLPFDGDLIIESSATKAIFDIQNFVSVLNTVTSDAEIKPKMLSVRGTVY